MKAKSRNVYSAVAFVVGALAAAMGLLCPRGAGAQSSIPREETWVIDGPVNAIVCTPVTVYSGGTFTHVGPNTGYGVPISAVTGEAVAPFPKAKRRTPLAFRPVRLPGPDGNALASLPAKQTRLPVTRARKEMRT